VTPIESMVKEAKVKCEEMVEPFKDKLKEKRVAYEKALARYNETKEKLLKEQSTDLDFLLGSDMPADPRNASFSSGAVYGIASNGEVFSFTNDELKLLIEKFGNPLENVK